MSGLPLDRLRQLARAPESVDPLEVVDLVIEVLASRNAGLEHIKAGTLTATRRNALAEDPCLATLEDIRSLAVENARLRTIERMAGETLRFVKRLSETHGDPSTWVDEEGPWEH